MMKLIKNNIKLIIGFVFGLTFSAVAVYAATVAGTNVTYSTTNSAAYGATKTNVQEAIDELYQMANSDKFFLKTYLNKVNAIPVISYSTDGSDFLSSPPSNKNVYLSTSGYSDRTDSFHSICIKKGNQQHCFSTVDTILESLHLESVFASDTCNGKGDCNDSNLYCHVAADYVKCQDKSDNDPNAGSFGSTKYWTCVFYNDMNYECAYSSDNEYGF